MIETLLILVLVFESIRLVLYLRDSHNVNVTNKKAREQQAKYEEFAKTMHEEWKLIRAAEIEELKQLAHESDTMRQVYDEWKEQQAPNSERKVK